MNEINITYLLSIADSYLYLDVFSNLDKIVATIKFFIFTGIVLGLTIALHPYLHSLSFFIGVIISLGLFLKFRIFDYKVFKDRNKGFNKKGYKKNFRVMFLSILTTIIVTILFVFILIGIVGINLLLWYKT